MHLSANRNTWRVLLLDTKRSNPNHYLCLAIKMALETHKDVELVISPVLGEAWNLAQIHQCNLFIAFDGEELHRGICGRLAKLCGRSVLWVTEDPYERQVNVENSVLFDLVFTNDSASVSIYRHKGRHLPLAASPNLHFASVRKNEDCLYDLFFAGTAWPNRVELIQQLLVDIDNLKTKLVLPHNEYLPDPLDVLSLPKSAFSWRISNQQFVQFANRSRIVLSLHREFTSSLGGAPMALTPGPRFFEVALAGGFQLVDMSLSESDVYFDEGKEFAGFYSLNEAYDQLRHYLSHPDERISIAEAAQKRVLDMHLYAHRIDVVLTEIASLSSLHETPSVYNVQKRPIRVLHVTHNLIINKPFGGIEVYQDRIVRGFENNGEFEFLFLVPDNPSLASKIRLVNAQYEIIEETTFLNSVTQEVLTNPEREAHFSRLLTAYSIDIVHFQHLLGHVPSLPYIARALGLPTVLSLHDYYCLCWQFNLLDHTGQFCEPENITETACDICISAQRGGLPHSQSCRRSFFGRMLSHVDILHFNTGEVAHRYKSVYPLLMQHRGIQVNGVPITDGISPHVTPANRPIRVVILGNFIVTKGADFLIHLFCQMKSDNVLFEVLGYIEPTIQDEVNQLTLPNVTFKGGYTPAQQTDLLCGASIALFASKWPETYCLSLSEAWQAGLVPIAPEIGAFAERIQHGINGFKFKPGHLAEAVDHLRLLIEDEVLLTKVQMHIGEHLYETISSHSEWLTNLYLGLAGVSSSSYELESYPDSAEPVLHDCGVTLTHHEWLRIDPQQPQELIHQTPLHVHKSNTGFLLKSIRFLYRYGAVKTFWRVVNEIRKRYGNKV